MLRLQTAVTLVLKFSKGLCLFKHRVRQKFKLKSSFLYEISQVKYNSRRLQ